MPADPPSRERRFYLEEFAGRTVVIGLDAGAEDERVDGVVTELVEAGVRVVLLGPGGRVAHWRPDDAGIVSAWRQLRRHGRMRIALPDGHDVLADAVRLAARLRATKLVLLDDDAPGPEDRADAQESFVALDGRTPPDGRLAELAAQALADGVGTVSACRPADLAQELLTYAGAGTCWSRGDYCQVVRLGIDDYDQVAQLIAHGVEEGYLKPRDPDDIARLVVNGYGGVVGEHHLAGFAALLTEPYADDALGELCGLTTISRFAGGGVGSQVVDRVLRDAAGAGLHGVFAVTGSETAARFFRRLGFVEVPAAELPAAKWAGDDPGRRDGLRSFVHHLAMLG